MGSEQDIGYRSGILPPPIQHLRIHGESSRTDELVFKCPYSAAIPTRSRHDPGHRYPTPGSVASTDSSTLISPDRDDSTQTSSVSSFDSDTFLPPLEQRQNPRRTSNNITPPSFKRADEGHKTFIEGLLAVTTSFVEAIWPLSRETPRSSTDFNGAGVLPLKTFIQETCRRSRTSYSTLQIALYYLVLLKGVLPDVDFTREQCRESDGADVTPKDPHVWLGQPSGPSHCRVMQCGRRMFMSALMLAAKYLQDRNFSVKAWAKISGLSCVEINKNEKAYLQCIEYRLHLKKEYFDNWSRIVLLLCKSEKDRTSLDYAKVIRDLTPEIVQDAEQTAHFLQAVDDGNYDAFAFGGGCSPPDWRRVNHDTSYPGLQSMRIPSTQANHITSKSLGLALAVSESTQPDDQIPMASIYSCPPPRQEYAGMSSSCRRQFVSPPWPTPAHSSKSSSSSPESTVESVFDTENVSRSRSSSISSTSSFGSIRSFRVDVKATPQPSPLGRACVTARQVLDAGHADLRGRILINDQPSHLNVTPSRSQALAGCAKRKTCSAPLSMDNAAATLVLLSKQRGQHGILPAAEDHMLPNKKAHRKRGSTKGLKAGHTSESVKARRQLQREASRLVKSGHGLPDAIPDDSFPVSDYARPSETEQWSSSEETEVAVEDKENQAGHKLWAGSRKPMPVAANKRFAADMAVSMLRSEMKNESEMCMAR